MHILKQSMPLTDSEYLNICMQRECEFVDYLICLASALAGYLFSLLNALEVTSSGLLENITMIFFSFFSFSLRKTGISCFLFKMFYTQKSMPQQANSNTVVEGISRSTSLRHCDKATSLGSFPCKLVMNFKMLHMTGCSGYSLNQACSPYKIFLPAPIHMHEEAQGLI